MVSSLALNQKKIMLAKVKGRQKVPEDHRRFAWKNDDAGSNSTRDELFYFFCLRILFVYELHCKISVFFYNMY